MSDRAESMYELPSPHGDIIVTDTQHDAMACTWGIRILNAEPQYAHSAARAAFEEIDRLERELSRFIDTSDVARINTAAVGQPVRIGPDAFECLNLASQLHARTDGAFDVTIGALLTEKRPPISGAVPPPTPSPRPRGDGRVRGSPDLPAGMQHLALDNTAFTVTRLREGLLIDLGAIGKGYAVDQAVRILRDWSIDAALVHSGQSTVYALGAPPDNDSWHIGVRNPQRPNAILRTARLRDASLSGSGRAIRGNHIVDPRSGIAATARLGAWAISSSAAVSDAISTALMVLDDEAAAELRAKDAALEYLLCDDAGDRLAVITAGASFAL